MKAAWIGCLTGLALLSLTDAPARADVAMSGTFIASENCPAWQSMRKMTNPGGVTVRPHNSYDVLAKNKPDATHVRIVVAGAQPAERWVKLSCGTLAATASPTAAPPVAVGDGARTKGRANATHVLALGWEPEFCLKHGDKPECAALKPATFAATHLSLHGLWPQPRGTEYCNVAPEVANADHQHNWDALPEPQMTAATRQRLAAVMPGVQSNLQRHEWIVHGTCYGANADAYFSRAAGLADAVNASNVSQVFASSVGKTLSADAIRAAFDEAFGAGAGARVAVSCQGRGPGRKISELTLGLAGDVNGTAPLGDLMRAAAPVAAGCPGGLIQQPAP